MGAIGMLAVVEAIEDEWVVDYGGRWFVIRRC